jgi:hypothetical protein
VQTHPIPQARCSSSPPAFIDTLTFTGCRVRHAAGAAQCAVTNFANLLGNVTTRYTFTSPDTPAVQVLPSTLTGPVLAGSGGGAVAQAIIAALTTTRLSQKASKSIFNSLRQPSSRPLPRVVVTRWRPAEPPAVICVRQSPAASGGGPDDHASQEDNALFGGPYVPLPAIVTVPWPAQVGFPSGGTASSGAAGSSGADGDDEVDSDAGWGSARRSVPRETYQLISVSGVGLDGSPAAVMLAATTARPYVRQMSFNEYAPGGQGTTVTAVTAALCASVAAAATTVAAGAPAGNGDRFAYYSRVTYKNVLHGVHSSGRGEVHGSGSGRLLRHSSTVNAQVLAGLRARPRWHPSSGASLQVTTHGGGTATLSDIPCRTCGIALPPDSDGVLPCAACGCRFHVACAGVIHGAAATMHSQMDDLAWIGECCPPASDDGISDTMIADWRDYSGILHTVRNTGGGRVTGAKRAASEVVGTGTGDTVDELTTGDEVSSTTRGAAAVSDVPNGAAEDDDDDVLMGGADDTGSVGALRQTARVPKRARPAARPNLGPAARIDD